MTVATATDQQLHQLIAQVHDRLDDLEYFLPQIVELSWGPGDDGTNATPCPDGTATDIRNRLSRLAIAAMAICEHTKDLAQP